MCWKKLFFNRRVVFLVFASLLLSFENIFSLSAQETSVSLTNEIRGGDFTLNSSEGPLYLKDLRGSVVLLFFGYTSCPSVCPISLATMSSVFSKMLPDDLKRAKALFISLDPERDDVAVLKQYTGYFHPNILGLTEDIAVVIKVAEQYGIKYEKTFVPESTLGYVISHSSDIIVLGLDGKPRRTFPHNTSATPLKEFIIYLLNENL